MPLHGRHTDGSWASEKMLGVAGPQGDVNHSHRGRHPPPPGQREQNTVTRVGGDGEKSEPSHTGGW